MSHDQKNRAGCAALVKGKQPLNEPVRSIRHLAAHGFDSFPTQQAAQCGQYQYGGTMPIVAHAARVSPAVGEVQL